MDAPDQAITGWTKYVLEATKHLPGTHPVDERMAQVLAGENLPYWLENGIRIKLVAHRGEALVHRAKARARPPLVDTAGNSLSP